ncbi:MAG: hypothetical protein M3Y57_15915 [Acidobacteriota bacterium]|nr:hypothetical protein [Acidobacteriota bacterium]
MTKLENCNREERELALQKALQSRTFARSEQLKAFLRFICESEALRPGAPLTEYVIGVEVLGRPEGYSPAEDSAVRTRAYELRQKLDRLYSTELPNEPVRILVPKGTYSPQYVKPSGGLHLEIVTPDPPHPRIPERLRTSALSLTIAIVISLLLGSGATWLVMKAVTQNAGPDPALVEAWGPLAKHDQTVALCVATPLSLVLGPLEHDVYDSHSYSPPDEAYSLFKQHRFLPSNGRLGMTFSDNMIAVGTMNAAMVTARTLRSFGTSYQLLPERVSHASSLRGRNVVFLGAPVDSEAIALAMRDVPLAVDFEPSIREFVIRDKSTGKFTAPKKDASGDFTEVYGLITVKTARDSDRKRVQTVLFSGITSVGSQGAAEFFSSPSAMTNLRSTLAKEGSSGFPAVYQVVIKCSCMNQLVLSADYYSHRIVRRTV